MSRPQPARDLGAKTVTLLTPRKTLQRIPDEGVCWPSGKVRYRTSRLAKQALCVARKLPTWEGSPDGGDVYRHPVCRSWHVTHIDPNPPREAA